MAAFPYSTVEVIADAFGRVVRVPHSETLLQVAEGVQAPELIGRRSKQAIGSSLSPDGLDLKQSRPVHVIDELVTNVIRSEP